MTIAIVITTLVYAFLASAPAQSLAADGPRSQALANSQDLNVSLWSFPAVDNDALRAEDEQKMDKADSIYRVGVELMAGAVDIMAQGGVTQVRSGKKEKAQPDKHAYLIRL